MFNLFLRSACVRSSHCFVWFELSSQAGLAVPEPQKNVRGELVVLQNSSHLHRVVQKKYSWWPGKSWDWFGRKRRKYRQHCPTSQVHPWQDLLWDRLQIMICSFKSEHVVQIAIILINSQACWDNRVCCNQYEHQLKCSEREIYQSHQYQQNPQEHGQQTISCSVESSLPGWTTLSRLFPTKLMRAGLWFQRKTWDEYRKYTFHSIWLRFRNSIWFLSSIPEVKNFIGAVEDEGRKKLVRKDEKKCHHCHHHHHQLNTGDGDYGRVLRHRSACGQSAGTGLDEQFEIRNFTRLLM